jgi:hypothetical protein
MACDGIEKFKIQLYINLMDTKNLVSIFYAYK